MIFTLKLRDIRQARLVSLFAFLMAQASNIVSGQENYEIFIFDDLIVAGDHKRIVHWMSILMSAKEVSCRYSSIHKTSANCRRLLLTQYNEAFVVPP